MGGRCSWPAESAPPPGVTVVGSFRELFRVIREEVMI